MPPGHHRDAGARRLHRARYAPPARPPTGAPCRHPPRPRCAPPRGSARGPPPVAVSRRSPGPGRRSGTYSDRPPWVASGRTPTRVAFDGPPRGSAASPTRRSPSSVMSSIERRSAGSTELARIWADASGIIGQVPGEHEPASRASANAGAHPILLAPARPRCGASPGRSRGRIPGTGRPWSRTIR